MWFADRNHHDVHHRDEVTGHGARAPLRDEVTVCHEAEDHRTTAVHREVELTVGARDGVAPAVLSEREDSHSAEWLSVFVQDDTSYDRNQRVHEGVRFDVPLNRGARGALPEKADAVCERHFVGRLQHLWLERSGRAVEVCAIDLTIAIVVETVVADFDGWRRLTPVRCPVEHRRVHRSVLGNESVGIAFAAAATAASESQGQKRKQQ
ncbi:MAG: hypothetical protein KC586_03435 [Myxococcales bacterium]|nr:hypothetical protein [Myxococcales bacterium]